MPVLANLRATLGLAAARPTPAAAEAAPAADRQRDYGYPEPPTVLRPALPIGDTAYGEPPQAGLTGATEYPPKQLLGGRQSWDDQIWLYPRMSLMLPPDRDAEAWRTLTLDADTTRDIPASRLMQLLMDASPDVSRGLWDFLRMTNPGWKATAVYPGTTRPHKRGQAIVDAFVAQMGQLYGSINVPIGKLHFGAYLRGALMAELVLDEQARTAIDLATPDPATARFRRDADPQRGSVYVLGQYQGGAFIELLRPTIKYIPIDPLPGQPYGRPPVAPAVFTSLFLLGMLHDLRRVVAQQGYPRLHLQVALEALAKSAPPGIVSDPKKWQQWVNDSIAEVQQMYNQLEPDSAFVSTDVVDVKGPVGTVSTHALGAVDALINLLERQTARALKTMPLLMGELAGSSEANANRQWELHVAGIRSVQQLSAQMLSDFGTLMCQAAGVAAEVQWVFDELRAAELYRDAMTRSLEIDNASREFFMGLISLDEVAQRLEQGQKADQRTPRLLPSNLHPPGNEAAPADHATSPGDPSSQPPEHPAGQGLPDGHDGNAKDPNMPHAQPGLQPRRRLAYAGAWQPRAAPVRVEPVVLTKPPKVGTHLSKAQAGYSTEGPFGCRHCPHYQPDGTSGQGACAGVAGVIYDDSCCDYFKAPDAKVQQLIEANNGQKVSKADAEFVHVPDAGYTCAECTYYDAAERRCWPVRGPIAPDASCDKWMPDADGDQDGDAADAG